MSDSKLATLTIDVDTSQIDAAIARVAQLNEMIQTVNGGIAGIESADLSIGATAKLAREWADMAESCWSIGNLPPATNELIKALSSFAKSQ